MKNKDRIETVENHKKNEIIQTYCKECGIKINHQILMNYYVFGKYISDTDFDSTHGYIEYTADFFNDYQIIKCSGCNTISYRSYNYFSEYQDIDNDGTWEERYPRPEERLKKKFYYLPSLFKHIYNEIIEAYNKKCFILCSVGIRALLEGICKEKGIIDGNLEQKINKLHENSFINSQHKDILHKIRFLGNYAVHELQTPTKKEIITAMDIIEHIIESLYEVLGKAKILRKGKNNSKAPTLSSKR
jgi:hypothetical protein